MYFNLEDVWEWSSWVYSAYQKKEQDKGREKERERAGKCELDLIPEFTWQSFYQPSCFFPASDSTLLFRSPLCPEDIDKEIVISVSRGTSLRAESLARPGTYIWTVSTWKSVHGLWDLLEQLSLPQPCSSVS